MDSETEFLNTADIYNVIAKNNNISNNDGNDDVIIISRE